MCLKIALKPGQIRNICKNPLGLWVPWVAYFQTNPFCILEVVSCCLRIVYSHPPASSRQRESQKKRSSMGLRGSRAPKYPRNLAKIANSSIRNPNSNLLTCGSSREETQQYPQRFGDIYIYIYINLLGGLPYPSEK